MSLLNVRLDPDDARMAAELRSAGVPISALVRAAIRGEYERRIARGRRGRRASEVVLAILESLPDPPAMPPRPFASNDRHAVRRHVAAKLAGKRP